jgi:hypothetical protein
VRLAGEAPEGRLAAAGADRSAPSLKGTAVITTEISGLSLTGSHHLARVLHLESALIEKQQIRHDI